MRAASALATDNSVKPKRPATSDNSSAISAHLSRVMTFSPEREPGGTRLVPLRSTGSRPRARSVVFGSSAVAGEFEQDAAAGLVGVLVAAVVQDHDPEAAARHDCNIGARIVEAAVLFEDRRLVATDDLPGQRLRIMRAHGVDALLRQVDGILERMVDRELTHIGGQEFRQIARR